MSKMACSARGLLVALLLLPFMAALPAQALTLQGGINQSVSAPQPDPDDPGIVGLNINVYHNKSPKILEVYPGTPAAWAHMQPGDVILAVDGRTAKGLSKDELDDAISDVPGQTVRFTIQRDQQVGEISVVVMAESRLHSQPVAHLYQSVFGE